MDITQSLAQLGLTQNESQIYTHLLKTNKYAGSEAYKELNLDKSSFYRSLKRLEEMGLVMVEGEKRNQKYFPVGVSALQKIYKQKTKQLAEVGENLTNLAREIEAYSSKNFLKNNIEVYEGEQAYYDFMEQKLKGKVELIRDITVPAKNLYSIAGSKKAYDDYIADYIRRRVAKGTKIRMLLDSTVKPTNLQIPNPQDLKEVRQYKGKLNSDCFLNVFGDRTGFFTEKAGKFWGVIIKDNLIASLTASMFDVVWDNSEPFNN
jgi:sugar-specific transcriptional regulator TrmB